MAEEAVVRPAKKWAVGLAMAVCAGLLYGFGLYALFSQLSEENRFISWGFLYGVPLAAPALGVLIWDRKGVFPRRDHGFFGAAVVTAMLVVGVIFLGEGGICALMVSPIFYFCGVFGAIIMGTILRRRPTRMLSIALLALPLMGAAGEGHVIYPTRNETVTSVAIIGAPPSRVWANLTEVRDIKPSELGWTFTQDVMGVPKPVDARLQGRGVGAVRHALWGRNVHFDEQITRWDQDHYLEWRFRFTPDSIPRVLEGHVRVESSYLKVLRGDYTLMALPGGRTRLILRTHYWMRTPLNGYCAWWGRLFVGDFHRNVLRVIRERSQATI